MIEKPPTWEIRGLNKSIKEATIKKDILNYLNSFPHSHFIINRPGAESGEADITGCINGQRCEFEVKKPGKKPRKLQQEKLKLWANAGAITDVVYSVHDVEACLASWGFWDGGDL